MHYQTNDGSQVVYKYRACTDCLFFGEFGNHDEFAECLGRDEWDARQAELEEAHARCHYPEPQCEEDASRDEFSAQPCDICGSRLAGARETMTARVRGEEEK